MVFWLLAGLGLYLLQVYAAAAIYLPTEGIMTHMGGRDSLPEKGVLAGRADRALVNMKENLPVFITLALLALILESSDLELATTGAMIWVWSRLAYFLLYLAAVPFVRSAAWTVSMAGLVTMLISVL